MDIRHFFKRQRMCDEVLSSCPAEDPGVTCFNVATSDQSEASFHQQTAADIVESTRGTAPTVSSHDVVSYDDSPSPCLGLNQGDTSKEATRVFNNYDLGEFLDKAKHPSIPDSLKLRLLKDPWTPDVKYDFKKDVTSVKRSFRYQWLADYSPWLAYSATAKGALCRYCVTFPPNVHRGTQGSFIVRAFMNYKKMHEACRDHVKSQWHQEAMAASQDFMNVMMSKQLPVAQQLNRALHHQVEKNREKLFPIVSTIIFCATHDLPIRGKQSDSGVFNDLLDFRVEAGDARLQEHFASCAGNAKYTSVRIQNEIITICGDILREQIVSEANTALAFSVLADETADIGGTEQLSIGIRFIDKAGTEAFVREQFMGFLELEQLNSACIAATILKFLKDAGLILSNLVGQGYDGCSTMAGKEAGVNRIIQKELPKALFFHCASHKLNLVINDLNEVSEIRNTIGVIKQTINFFRESVLRRKLVPNIPMLCETRWSAKYKSIRIFSEHYVAIVEALEDLASMESSSNAATRERAHILHCATTSSSFIVCLHIVAKYSARLEPVTNILQSVSMNFHSVHNHITELQNIFRGHRTNAEEQFSDIMKTASEAANHLGVLISVPRQASRQAHRDNYGIQLPEEYYRVAIYVPYLDSLNASLARRFSESNKKSYRLLQLHPARMKHLSRVEFAVLADELQGFYGIENFKEEGISWYEMWLNRTGDCSEISYPELLLQAKTFFPAVANAIEVALALPVTTCTVERSFSTLRRVKTWLRSTMRNDRLDGLCMMSVHRERVMKHKDDFITRVITQFAQKNPRRLQLLFKED